MKVKLLRDARILHKSGEIVEVSPEECWYLVSTDGAVEMTEAVKVVKAEPVEVPEEKVAKAETPEKKAKPTRTAAKKTVTKKK